MTESLRTSLLAALAGLVVACLWHLDRGVLVTVLGGVTALGLAAIVPLQLAVDRRSRGLVPRRLFGTQVLLVPDSSVACTAGPLRPRVLLGERLLVLLDEDELRAVVLHERAHQRRWDPLRAVVTRMLQGLRPTWATSSAATARRDARREIRADAAALRDGASRPALAAALLKVAPAPAATVGFASATEQRVRVLLGHEAPVAPVSTHWFGSGVGALAGLVTCVWMLHAPVAAAPLVCC